MSTDRQQCVCGHPRETHEHYRRGSDCSLCGLGLCPRFRRPSILSAFLAGRRPSPSGSTLSVVPESEPSSPGDSVWHDQTRDDAAS